MRLPTLPRLPALPALPRLPRISPRTRWLAAGVLLLSASVAVGVFWTRPKTAQVMAVQRADLTQTVVATGRINAAARIDVGSEATATVQTVHVSEGDLVKAGDMLIQLGDAEARATLTQAEAAQAEAQARQQQQQSVSAPVALAAVQQAQASLRNAEAEHRRTSELVAQGFFSQQKLDDSRRALDTARSALDSARSQSQAQQPNGVEVTLATTRIQQAQAAVGAARARLNRLRIVSPVDAVVLARHAEPGALAQPGKVLLSLAARGSGLRIDAGVDEKHLSLMKPGLAARAVADAYPTQPFDARLDWISPQVDASRGTVDVRLSVPKPPIFLRPDMTVSVEMTVGQQPQALVLNTAAVREPDSASPWALLLKDGVATRTPITLGLRGTGVIEVKSGLEEGDLLIPATEKVGEGDRVKAGKVAAVPLAGSGMGGR